MALLREARRLRDEARRLRMTPVHAHDGDGKKKDGGGDGEGGGGGEAGGLRSNFAVESSGYDEQRNMDAFVEERLALKFGRRGKKDGSEDPAKRSEADESEEGLYVIPARLRVQGAAAYDPSDGLPAAGMEEVDIGAAARRANAEATVAAERLLGEPGHGGRVEDSGGVVGNVAVNFEQHRRDWLEARVGAGGNEGKEGKDGKDGESRKRGAASDALLMDRFRKRWRK